MDIIPEISKNGWRVLLTVASKPASASDIVKMTGMGKSRVSESLHELAENGITKPPKRKKTISTDTSLKNALQYLLIKYPEEQLAKLLAAKNLNIMLQVLNDYDTVQKLKLVTGYSTSTLKRSLKMLQDNLLIYQPQKGKYLIRDEFEKSLRLIYSLFFAIFLENINAEWKDIVVFGNMALLKSTQKEIPGFVQTGFSLFHKYGVETIGTSSNYFVNFERQPKKEEVFLHALVFSLGDQRNLMLCMVLADKNNLKPWTMTDLLKIYKVEKEATAIFDFLKTKGKLRADFLPTYEEYLSVRRLYG
jgi:DNA-binding transcriptional regulator GbsR (MarR family)